MSHARTTTTANVLHRISSVVLPAFQNGLMGTTMGSIQKNAFGSWMFQTFGSYLTWCPLLSRAIGDGLGTCIYSHPINEMKAKGGGSFWIGSGKGFAEYFAGAAAMGAFGYIMVETKFCSSDNQSNAVQFNTGVIGGMIGDLVFQGAQRLTAWQLDKYWPKTELSQQSREWTNFCGINLKPAQLASQFIADSQGWAIMGEGMHQMAKYNGCSFADNPYYFLFNCLSANTLMTMWMPVCASPYTLGDTYTIVDERRARVSEAKEALLTLPLAGDAAGVTIDQGAQMLDAKEVPSSLRACEDVEVTAIAAGRTLKKAAVTESVVYLSTGAAYSFLQVATARTEIGKAFFTPSSPFQYVQLGFAANLLQETSRRLFGALFGRCRRRPTPGAEMDQPVMDPPVVSLRS